MAYKQRFVASTQTVPDLYKTGGYGFFLSDLEEPLKSFLLVRAYEKGIKLNDFKARIEADLKDINVIRKDAEEKALVIYNENRRLTREEYNAKKEEGHYGQYDKPKKHHDLLKRTYEPIRFKEPELNAWYDNERWVRGEPELRRKGEKPPQTGLEAFFAQLGF